MPQNIKSFKNDRKEINGLYNDMIDIVLGTHRNLLEILNKKNPNLVKEDYGSTKKDLYLMCDEMLELAT
jgi:hypothetical protein